MTTKNVWRQRLESKMINQSLCPRPKSDFEMISEMHKESVYGSHKRGELGKSRPFIAIPPAAVNNCFGKPTLKCCNIEELLYPSAVDSACYKSTYHDLSTRGNIHKNGVEEETVPFQDRKVIEDGVKELINTGDPEEGLDPCYLRDKKLRENKILHEEYIINLPTDCYPLHPIKTHDHFVKPHKNLKQHFKSIEGIVNAVRNRLKERNFHHFEDLETAFKAYDKNNTGKISAGNVEEMCKTFGMAVPIEIAKALIKECDKLDQDGFLSFQEFCLFLNWSDKIPLRKNSKEIVMFHTDAKPWVPESVLSNYQTVTSLFKAPDHVLAKSMKPAGIPHVRTDLPVPKERSFTNTVEYGEAAGIGAILQPTIFNSQGVYEIDLITPRKKDEIEFLLVKNRPLLSPEMLDTIWNA